MRPTLDEIFSGKVADTSGGRPSLDSIFRNTPPEQITPATPITPTKAPETATEKVAGFTGGKQIAQGLGQAIANPQIAKQQQDALNEAIKQQGQLLKAKKEIQALGGDTSHIDKGLELTKQTMEQISGSLSELLNQKGITGKQVIGSALQLGTTILGAGQVPGVAKAATGATGIIPGAIQGAKAGSIAGGIYGASSGVSGALQQDKSAAEIAQSGISGALSGAATGAVLGGVTGGISGGIKQHAINKVEKEKQFALDLVSPKQTEAVKQQALREGRVTEQGLLSASKITPSKRDEQLAESVKGVVSKNKSVVQNLDAVSKKVQDINTGVKAYVAEKKVPFNTKQLRSQLNAGKGELDLIFASDKNAEKTYDAVTKKFIELVKNKDTAGLLDARQEFDKIPAVKKLLESDKLGENARKEIVTSVRTQANKYVASLLPKGNQYRDALLKESRMIEVIGNLAEKNSGTIGMNKLQELTRKYPVLKGVIGTVGAYLGLKAIGIGGSIIGSSD